MSSPELFMSSLGTLAWSHHTGGNLDTCDRLRLGGQLLLVRLARLSGAARRALGLSDSSLSTVSGADFSLPESADARRALDHARHLLPGWLFEHSLRTFLWGRLLGRGRGIATDGELLFVAAVLHDLALTEARHCCVGLGCFAARGAKDAGAFAQTMGWLPERRQRLEDAISLHLNVRVPLQAGAEAHLLHDGAALDCIGAGLEELPPGAAASVLARHPRQDFKQRANAAFEAQSFANPASRIAYLMQLGFARRVGTAPFPE